MTSVVREDIAQVVEDLSVSYNPLANCSVLVTGASGMIGSYLVGTLLEISDRLGGTLSVTGLVRDRAKAARHLGVYERSHAFRIAVGDVSDPDLLVGPDATHIVHAASPASPAAFKSDPVGVIRANVIGGNSLLELARRNDAYFCYISSMEAYGVVEHDGRLPENLLREEDFGALDSLDLRSAYPESKRLVENLCVAFASQYNTSCDIARVSHTYGPGMSLDDARVQAEFIRAALAGDPISLQSDGSLRRTYTYVADVVSALLYMLLTKDSRSTLDVFNVADEDSKVTIRELAEAALVAAGRDSTELRIERPTDGRLWSKAPGGTFLDCSRLRALGWDARYSVDMGISRTIRHYREQALGDGDEKANADVL